MTNTPSPPTDGAVKVTQPCGYLQRGDGIVTAYPLRFSIEPLDDTEKAQGWVERPVYSAEAITAAEARVQERCAQVADREALRVSKFHRGNPLVSAQGTAADIARAIRALTALRTPTAGVSEGEVEAVARITNPSAMKRGGDDRLTALRRAEMAIAALSATRYSPKPERI